MVQVDLQGTKEFLTPSEPDYAAAAAAHRILAERSGAGSAFTGWLELPRRMADDGLTSVLAAAERIRQTAEVLVVVGIGGSYLGARAAIELLRSPGDAPGCSAPEVLFLGNTLSPDAVTALISRLEHRSFCVNVISKSGGTLEPALSFRVLKVLLEQRYGRDGAKQRIFVTTDARRGVLHDLAVSEGYAMFPVPDDVGGRYSVLSAVGLLPMAVAGIDVETVLRCAEAEFAVLDLRSPENPAWQYAATRRALCAGGRTTELLACYEPTFRFMAEWWKQLFGESEGKDGIGIFPASLEYSADLHSMGQYVQDGPRNLIETVVCFDAPLRPCPVPAVPGDPDGLNYLAGQEFADIQRIAQEAVRAAHVSGGVPNIVLRVPRRDEAGFAALVCFFELSCALSAYMSGVNPFNQPGVEAYKQKMFAMLRKER